MSRTRLRPSSMVRGYHFRFLFATNSFRLRLLLCQLFTCEKLRVDSGNHPRETAVPFTLPEYLTLHRLQRYLNRAIDAMRCRWRRRYRIWLA